MENRNTDSDLSDDEREDGSAEVEGEESVTTLANSLARFGFEAARMYSRSRIDALDRQTIVSVYTGYILTITGLDPPAPYVNQPMTISFSLINASTDRTVSGQVTTDAGDVTSIPNLAPLQGTTGSVIHTPHSAGRGQKLKLTFAVQGLPFPPSPLLEFFGTDVAVFDVRTGYILEVSDTYELPTGPTQEGWPDGPEWNKLVCSGRVSFDAAHLLDDKPLEWTPVLNSGDEMDGDIAVSGIICESHLSGDDPDDFSRDVAFIHPFHNDWEIYVALDEPYESLLAPTQGVSPDQGYNDATDYADTQGISHAKGFLGVEIQRGFVPVSYRGTQGQRVAMLGRWIVDCGHENYITEIHEPLLLAVGYEEDATDQPSKRTTMKLIGRPFFVSQLFNGHSVSHSLVDGFAERLAEAHLAALFPPALAAIKPVEIRPTVISPPFSGTRSLPLTVRPPTLRPSPDHTLHASYHFTIRSGVSVTVLPNAFGDELLITVSMDAGKYPPARLPSPQNVNVPWDGPKGLLAGIHGDGKKEIQALMGAAGILDVLVGLVFSKGFDTDRYDLLEPGGAHDFENAVLNAPVHGGGIATRNSGYSVDDNQPYPIYGWMSLEWVEKLIEHNPVYVNTSEVASVVAAKKAMKNVSDS